MAPCMYDVEELVAAAAGPVMDNEESFALIDEWDFGDVESRPDASTDVSESEDSGHGKDETGEHNYGDVVADQAEHVTQRFGGDGGQGGKSDQPHFIFADQREQDGDGLQEDTAATDTVGSTGPGDMNPDLSSANETPARDSHLADQTNAKQSSIVPTSSQQAPTSSDFTPDADIAAVLESSAEVIDGPCSRVEQDRQQPESEPGEQPRKGQFPQPVTRSLPAPAMAPRASQHNQIEEPLKKTPAMTARPAHNEPTSDKGSLYREMQREDNARQLRSSSSTPEVTSPSLFKHLPRSSRGDTDVAEGTIAGFEDIPGSPVQAIAEDMLDSGNGDPPEVFQAQLSQSDEADPPMVVVEVSAGQGDDTKNNQSKKQTRARTNNHHMPNRVVEQPITNGSRPLTRKAMQEAAKPQVVKQPPLSGDTTQKATGVSQLPAAIPKKRRGRPPKVRTGEETALAGEPPKKKQKSGANRKAATQSTKVREDEIINAEATAVSEPADDGRTDVVDPTSNVPPNQERDTQQQSNPMLTRAAKALQGYWNTIAGEAPTSSRGRGGSNSIATSTRPDSVHSEERPQASQPANNDNNPTAESATNAKADPTTALNNKRQRYPLSRNELSMLGTASAREEAPGMKTRARTAKEAEVASPPSKAVNARRKGNGKGKGKGV